MRVGIIAPPWVPVPPVAYGGTELMLDTLARGLDQAGHEVVLFTTGDSTCPVERRFLLPNSEGMKMGTLMIEIGHSLAAYEQIGDVDVVHDHTAVGPLCSVGKVNFPVVTTNHGPFHWDTMDYWRGITARNISIIAISADQASHADEDIEVAQVIHHGIDAARIPEGQGDGEYLACLGRMAADKGIHAAIHLARKAGKRLLIGAKMREPLEREYFETMVKPHLDSNIEYLGELNTKDKFDLLCGAEALLNPIQWAEPFGLVMIEAMACGTPVITQPIGAAPEIVTHGLTGYLASSEKQYMEAIANVAQLDRRSCRFEIETTFSMQRMVKDHLEFYSKVIAQHQSKNDHYDAIALDLARQVNL